MPPRHPQLADCIKRKALRFGSFRLVSGATSSYYLDGKMISFDPEGAQLIVEALDRELANVTMDAFGGMDMGATPIVAAYALHSALAGRPVPTFVVRKTTKAHGTQKKIEGPIPPAPATVVVVDDVVTSGGSIIQAIEALRQAGYTVALTLSIIDRHAGGREALEALGVSYQPLVTLDDLGVA